MYCVWVLVVIVWNFGLGAVVYDLVCVLFFEFKSGARTICGRK